LPLGASSFRDRRSDGVSPEIGERLFISRATVKKHLPHMLDKLSVADRAELATFPNAQLAKRASERTLEYGF
jgi:DNA-binding NarL/FixJ family response regulator